jgi:hypothetical protein
MLVVISGCSISDLDQTNAASEANPRNGVDYCGLTVARRSARRPATFAARYLSYDTNGKNITANEAGALHAAGLDLVLN